MKLIPFLFLVAVRSVLGQDLDLPDDFIVTPRIGDTPQSRGGQISKQRIGPYNLAAGATIKGWFTPVASPCILTGCFLTAFEASLEYENGTEANTDTGAWLHHMILNANGGGRLDLTCPEYLPGIPRASRIFASGNERPTTRLDADKPYGIKLKPFDTMDYILELMNEAHEARTVWVTVKFEWTTDSSYKEASLVFLDAAGGCYFSEVPAQTGVYSIQTRTWKSTVKGNIITGLGHVHDGGDRVEIYRNGQLFCTSTQLYGMTSKYISNFHEGHEMTHISHSGVCENVGRIEVGENYYAISHYDTNKYPLMEHDGVAHSIMSIGVFWVALE